MITPSLHVNSARGMFCPKCNSEFGTTLAVNAATFKHGDKSICVVCDTFLQIIKVGLLFSVQVLPENELPKNAAVILANSAKIRARFNVTKKEIQ